MSFVSMGNVGRDLRQIVRRLLRSPGFATVAILTLTLGIGATTAIFTLVYDALLKPLPYPRPDRLVVMQESVAEFKDIYPTLPVNANHFVDWRQYSHSFESMAVMRQDSMPLGTGGHPLQISVLRSTPGVFSVLGVAPQLGRQFTKEENQPGRANVVVLMNGLWESQFHGDPRILGKTVPLNGYPYTVIGVMPANFVLPNLQGFGAGVINMNRREQAEALIPIAFTKEQLQDKAGEFNYFGLARLKPGVSVERATGELNAFEHTISASLSADEKMTLSAELDPFQQYLVGANRKPLLILLAAVAGLLLIGCINLANLLLARAVGRRKELAVATALGARRSDLLRASLGEACVLAFIGCALGILLTAAAVPLLQHFLPAAIDFRGALHVDWAGAGFAVLLAVCAALLAGAAPVWMSWRSQPQEALQGESRTSSESRGGKRLRKILVGAEVAISVALVLVTGLLMASLYQLMNVEHGFEASRVLTARVDMPSKGYSDRKVSAEFYRKLLGQVQQLPGVESVGITSILPLNGDSWIDILRVRGDGRPLMQLPTEHFRWVSPGYFSALRLPLVAGRFLSDDDYGKNDAVISELAAKTLWPGKDPIGQQFTRDVDTFTVVGVVGNARTIELARPDPMMVYVPYWYRSGSGAGIVLRTRQDPSAMANALRKSVWSIDPAVAVPDVRTLSGIVSNSVATRRFEMDLLLLFAVCAWLLAGLGVYGVVTYSVVQRKQEIGVRMALGAQRANIYAQVLREGLKPVIAGAIVGIAAAFGFARLLESLLFRTSPFNPAIAICAVALLLVAGAAACLLPARRAASVDPIQALRAE